MFKTILLLLTVIFCAPATAQTLYEVVRVIDGDTYVIDVGETIERVRITRIDSPEVYPKSKVEPLGPEASAFARELLTGKHVHLEIGTPMRDRFGRLLAAVYLEDGRDVALLLVQAGLAELTLEFLEAEHAEVYAAAMLGAFSASKGMWTERGVFKDKNCNDFTWQEEAQAFFLGAQTMRYRDRHRLDKNGDNVVCTDLPQKPPSYLPPIVSSSQS